MSERRTDSIFQRTVIVAERRAARPIEFPAAPVRRKQGDCPFCPGNEASTPAEIDRIDDPSGNWVVRAVPNKYPAVVEQHNGSSPTSFGNGPFAAEPVCGGHEVIIESPQHIASTSQQSVEQVELVWSLYARRLHAWSQAAGFAQLFKNCGPAAGASIEHLHSQLIALDQPPPAVVEENRALEGFHAREKVCGVCRAIETEIAHDERIVYLDDDWIAFCPWASRFPYEVWIAPRQHAARFETESAARCGAAGRLVQRAIKQLERELDEPAYNYLIQTAPFDSSACDHYHWHIVLFPRITTQAGFEWATGCFINPVGPESAANKLSIPRD